jgi:hypothetical protein
MNHEKYRCNDCNKFYSNYNSLWTHNKKYHKCNNVSEEKATEEKTTEEKTTEEKTTEEKTTEEKTTEYTCIKCNKKYKHNPSKCRHEKTCNGTKQPSLELEVEKMKQETLDKEVEVEKIKQETLKLKIKLQGMKRVDNKTFKAINKVLIDRSTHNNNIQNITNNNYQIFSIGNEDVINTLSIDDKRIIINRKWCSIDEIVKMVHCGDHNMFKNILITNLKDKFAYTFDESKGYFITTTKSFILDDLITNRMMDIETIYDELTTANLVDEKTKKMIKAFLERMEEDDKPYTDENDDVEHVNYKAYKMSLIKLLLYNNQEKITQDIASLMN